VDGTDQVAARWDVIDLKLNVTIDLGFEDVNYTATPDYIAKKQVFLYANNIEATEFKLT
jgi:hypothetical protein